MSGLADAGITRAIVVAGYRSQQIDEHLAAAELPIDAVTVKNPAYATTNNAVSLAAARSAIAGREFVLCDGDVVFTVNPFPALLASPDSCVVAMDATAAFNAEAMKVALATDGRVRTLSKALTVQESAGESLGIQRIGGNALPRLWDALDDAIARDAVRSYYEDAFQQLLDRGLQMGVSHVVPGTCLEIDDAADLEAARYLLAGRT